MRTRCGIWLLMASVLVGCGKSNSGPAPAPIVLAPATPSAPAPPAVPANAAQESEQVVAKKGVGIQGRSLDEHDGIVVTPVKTLFAAREMAVFDIQVPQALQLFKAEDPNGAGPQSHDDFMAKVIEANQIKLPKLPEGHTYIFDPKTQQLMVRRPKAATQPQP